MNRRMRTRMYGGVGAEGGNALGYPIAAGSGVDIATALDLKTIAFPGFSIG